MITWWTCEGSVRGSCGTRHRTEEAAARHCRDDDRMVKRGHGRTAYSDRVPVEHTAPSAENDEARLLTAQEKVAEADGYAAAARAERDALAAELVAGGMTRYRVAQVLGVTQAAVTGMIERVLAGVPA